MNASKDYYRVLGVSANVDAVTIKRAYRKLALQWHPDRNHNPYAESMFKTVCQAYEILGDSSQRSLYDSLQFGRSAGVDSHVRRDTPSSSDFRNGSRAKTIDDFVETIRAYVDRSCFYAAQEDYNDARKFAGKSPHRSVEVKLEEMECVILDGFASRVVLDIKNCLFYAAQEDCYDAKKFAGKNPSDRTRGILKSMQDALNKTSRSS